MPKLLSRPFLGPRWLHGYKMASGSALATLERMLNGKTTLKTQKVSHKNIICKQRKCRSYMHRLFPCDSMEYMCRIQILAMTTLLTNVAQHFISGFYYENPCRLQFYFTVFLNVVSDEKYVSTIFNLYLRKINWASIVCKLGLECEICFNIMQTCVYFCSGFVTLQVLVQSC